MLGSPALAHTRRLVLGLGFDSVTPADMAQDTGGNRAALSVGAVQVLAPGMGYATVFGARAVVEQGLAAGVIVDHQETLPAPHEGRGRLALAAGRVSRTAGSTLPRPNHGCDRRSVFSLEPRTA